MLLKSGPPVLGADLVGKPSRSNHGRISGRADKEAFGAKAPSVFGWGARVRRRRRTHTDKCASVASSLEQR